MANLNNSTLMREKKIRRVARAIMEILEKNDLGLAVVSEEDEDNTVKICIIENMDRAYCLPINNLEPYFDVNIPSTVHFEIDTIILS